MNPKPLPARFALASALLVALTLAGCTTPVVQHAVEVPTQFASAAASQDEPELVWWESFGDTPCCACRPP